MKLLKFITLALISSLSQQAFADIQLTVPSQVSLKVVNGEIAKQQNSLILKDGKNQIAFQYEGNYRAGGEVNYFTTDIILITFEGNNQDYTMSLPRLRSEKQINQFNEQPEITLTDTSGKAVSFEQGKLMKNGIQFNRDLVAEAAAYNQTDKPASLHQPATIIVPANGQTEGDVAGQMLDYWYKKADEKTRAQFKARINQ
ncbi:YccT family protein [Pseudoalteromonas sp. KJ10-2]|uniref:YccT family protein n=1 Tax=Psychromonas sp. KJ10-2 TaxID=3391822 RepID=UPI0039B3F42D